MERSMNYMSDEGEMNWPDGHSMSSDDAVQEDLGPNSPFALDNNTWMTGAPTTQLEAGQISPISAGMDIAVDTCSAPAMVHSASSSYTDSWSMEDVDRDEPENDLRWEQGSDDVLTVPKLEPMDDDFNLNDISAAPLTPTATESTTSNQAKQKRPRGRPRKHPVTPVVGAAKVTKGRSKTGCITCRKRKKKCDEAKPRCMNCEKNAVVCEGYHEKQIWKSGKEKAEEERLRRESLPVITMQPLFHGVETLEDRIFWKHYVAHLSNVLTVEGEARNAFKDILLHLANEHQGLMHSILAVSGKHIDLDTPYGLKLLADNNNKTTRENLQQRSDYHHEEAMKRLYADMEKPVDRDDPEYQTILSAHYGQMLCLLLQTLTEGNPRGEHRVHLQAYRSLIQQHPPEDPALYTFITEFFQYHIYADDLFWHPGAMTKRLSSEDWEPPAPINPMRLIGVGDGLFQFLSQITTIRNTIRANLATGADPVVDYTSLYQAAEIDAAIREWTPECPPGDSRDRVGLLYKQAMWVYLFRTIYPPSGSSVRRSTFSSMPILGLVPPERQRRASMAASFSTAKTPKSGLPKSFGIQTPQSSPSTRNPSRTNSMHEQDAQSSGDSARGSSPPPSRRPAYHDHRITLAVDEALAILDKFSPSDPVQTLLLTPCLIIGTACFEDAQRNRIRDALKAVRGYTGFRNCDRVSELLEKLWALMEQGDWYSVWDWQGLARRSELDFLC